MTKWGYGVLFIIFSLLLGGGIWAWNGYHRVVVGKAVPICDSALWAYVYHPARLRILEQCAEATGKVVLARREPDGDYHILLEGGLVLEPICQFAPRVKIAVAACKGFRGSLFKIPKAGTVVKVIGTRVFDTKHGWQELHPVTSIETVR